MSMITELGKRAKKAETLMRTLTTERKNEALKACADAILANGKQILKANQLDLEKAVKAGMSEGLQDRLRLDQARLEGIAEGVRQVFQIDAAYRAAADHCNIDHTVSSCNALCFCIQYSINPRISQVVFYNYHRFNLFFPLCFVKFIRTAEVLY